MLHAIWTLHYFWNLILPFKLRLSKKVNKWPYLFSHSLFSNAVSISQKAALYDMGIVNNEQKNYVEAFVA
jgi:hypothetical protein